MSMSSKQHARLLPHLVWAFAGAGLLSSSAGARELPNFPVALTEGTTKSSPAVGDVDGDGRLDIVVGFGEWLHVVTPSGAPLTGFPKKIGKLDPDAKKHFAASPSLCDLDGDGKLEIVTGGPDSSLYVVTSDGRYAPGWPVDLGAQIESAPLCADVDGDGKAEIVVAVPAVHVAGFTAQGKPLRGFPIKSIRPAESAIAAADLVPGGPLELMIGGDDGRLHFFDGKGVVDVRKTAKTSYKITGGPSLGDIDGDGQFDVVFGSQDFNLYAVDGKTFDLKPGFPVETGYRIYGSPALGDLSGDGVADIVVGSADGLVYATDGKGKPLPGWPVKVSGKVIGSVGIGDLDLDGQFEVVAVESTGQTYVFKSRGQRLRGTPFKSPGKNDTSPFIADLDGKRGLEIAVVTSRSRLHVFSVRPTGKLAAARVPWPGYAHDAQRLSRTHPNPANFLDLRVEPSRARTTDTLKVAYTYQDLDGAKEGATRVAWYRNGQRVKELDNKREVPSSMTKKGERWIVQVQEEDDFKLFGEGEGARILSSPQLLVLNTPAEAPGLAAVGAAQGEIRVGDDVTVQVSKPSKDVDNDTIRYRTIWSVDEAVVKLKRRDLTLPKGRAVVGQRIAVAVIPEDGEGDGEPSSMTWVVKNTPPSPPSVAITPSTPTRASGAKLVIQKAGVDPDRKEVSHRVEWLLDGKPLPLLADAFYVPGELLQRSSRLTAKVVAHDGSDPSTVVTTEAVVGNNAPGAPSVSILPSSPTADTALGVTVTRRADDPDVEVPTYHVAWELDGAVVPELNEQWVVPRERLKKGQRWRVVVTADDGAAKGPPARAQTIIGNRPPVAPLVAINPNPPVGAQGLDLKTLEPAKDPDGDGVRLKVEWLIDGAAQPARAMAGDGLKPGLIKKGQRVAVRVTPLDGTTSGTPAGDAVLVGDRPPTPPTVTLSPSAPRTRGEVSMTVARAGTDPDGDKVDYLTWWFVDGARVALGDDVTTLSGQYFREGEKVSVEVRSRADGLLSAPAKAEVTVVSTPPPAPTIAIEPSSPLPGEPLRVKVVEQPPDDDGNPVSYEVTWTNGGRAFPKATLDGVEPGVTKKGEGWAVRVTAVDGKDKAPSVTAQVTIGNQAPIAPRINLSKETVRTTEPVTLNITRPASDPDGDRVRLEITWLKNKAPVAALAGQTTVPAAQIKKGEAWSVEVLANDGTAKSDPVRATFSVIDTPPTAPSIAFSPAQPVAGSDVDVKITSPGTDVDGDEVKHNILWYIDGKKVRNKGFRMSGRKLKARKELMAEVWSAAAGESSTVTRVRAEVAPARPPPPQVSNIPLEPKPGQTRIANVDTPPGRSTPARILVSWLRDGGNANINAPTVPGSAVKRGQKWTVIAAAIVDGKRSNEVRDEVVIGNRPPSPPQMALSAREVTTDKSVSLSITRPASDPDNDTLTTSISWARDGREEGRFKNASTIPSSATSKGERWVATVVASDGQLSSPPVTDAFVVVDTPPPAVKVVLSPSRPTAGQAVTARITPTAADIDGDKVTYRVRYLVNGLKAKGHDGQNVTLDDKAFEHNDQIVVEVVPFDGEREGPVARASALSVNSAPTLKAVTVSPAKPTPGDTLSCDASGAVDPDGDTVAVHVQWQVDGKPLGGAGISAPFNPGQARPGQQVTCSAFATDGELVSSSVSSPAVQVVSRAPGGVEVAMVPAAPVTDDEVICGAKGEPKDADGDPIALEVTALVDGKSQRGPRVPPNTLKAGQRVECRATPKDPRATGALAKTEVTVGNARPFAPVPKLSHYWPRAGVDDLTCDVSTIAKDPERDKIRYRIEWFKNGASAGLPGNVRTIPARRLQPGDWWVCRLSAQDPGGEGQLGATAAALVREDPSGGTAGLTKGGEPVKAAGR